MDRVICCSLDDATLWDFVSPKYLTSDGIATFRCLEDRPVCHGEKPLGGLKHPQAQIRLGQEKIWWNHLDTTLPEYLLTEHEGLGATRSRT